VRAGRIVEVPAGRVTFRINGAGEMLVFSADDFEDFRQAASRHVAWDEPSSKRWCALLVQNRSCPGG